MGYGVMDDIKEITRKQKDLKKRLVESRDAVKAARPVRSREDGKHAKYSDLPREQLSYN